MMARRRRRAALAAKAGKVILLPTAVASAIAASTRLTLSYVTARQRLGQALAANASSVPIAAGRLGAPLRKLDRGMRNDRAHATIKERMREASAVGGNRYRG